MTSVRNTREDVVTAAGRLFAERGYHGTSMRDVGRELGLFGSSLYSHVESKQDLLVEVIEKGALLFQASAERAAEAAGTAVDRLHAFIAGHVDVLLDHVDEARTYLNEARVLDDEHRSAVVAARDRYEKVLVRILDGGREDGSFEPAFDPRLAAIFILSILNAVERWYSPSGRLDRAGLVEELEGFCRRALGAGHRL
jgi:AcrR family transcriptional regulator